MRSEESIFRGDAFSITMQEQYPLADDRYESRFTERARGRKRTEPSHGGNADERAF